MRGDFKYNARHFEDLDKAVMKQIEGEVNEEPDLHNFEVCIKVWSPSTLERMKTLIERKLWERHHDSP